MAWTGIAFGYIATTQGSTSATLVSEFGPVSPMGIPIPVFSDGTPGISTLAALYPPPEAHLPADWPLAGALSVFNHAGQSLPGMELSADLSTGGAITSLPINALGLDDLVLAWTTVTLSDPASGNSQNFVLAAEAPPLATSLPIVSATPNFAYPAGSSFGEATNYYTISGTTITTACAAVQTYAGNDLAWARALIWT